MTVSELREVLDNGNLGDDEEIVITIDPHNEIEMEIHYVDLNNIGRVFLQAKPHWYCDEWKHRKCVQSLWSRWNKYWESEGAE